MIFRLIGGAAQRNSIAAERTQRGGALIVHYRSLDQLDRVLRLLRPG